MIINKTTGCAIFSYTAIRFPRFVNGLHFSRAFLFLRNIVSRSLDRKHRILVLPRVHTTCVFALIHTCKCSICIHMRLTVVFVLI